MRSTRQPVATHGNGFRLSSPFRPPVDLPLIATSCTPRAPERLHPRSRVLRSHKARRRSGALGQLPNLALASPRAATTGGVLHAPVVPQAGSERTGPGAAGVDPRRGAG